MTARLGGNGLPGFIAEQYQAGRIMLPDHKLRENRGQNTSIVELVRVSFAKVHGSARIQKNLAAHIRVIFELLDVKLVRARPDFPVNVPQVVALGVSAVSRKLRAVRQDGT